MFKVNEKDTRTMLILNAGWIKLCTLSRQKKFFFTQNKTLLLKEKEFAQHHALMLHLETHLKLSLRKKCILGILNGKVHFLCSVFTRIVVRPLFFQNELSVFYNCKYIPFKGGFGANFGRVVTISVLVALNIVIKIDTGKNRFKKFWHCITIFFIRKSQIFFDKSFEKIRPILEIIVICTCWSFTKNLIADLLQSWPKWVYTQGIIFNKNRQVHSEGYSASLILVRN